MKMEKMPEVTKTSDGAYWKNTYEKFEAQVYVPKSPLLGDILNYGFMAPYLLVFADKKLSYEELVAFARQKGYEKLAADYDTSVVFISPVAEGSGQPCSWKEAAPDILSEIITNSRIHQYHKDGVVIANNFFRHSIDGYYIRGAIFRAILCGFGSGADYIAENCLHHFEGDGLWGRSDLAPAACILTGLTVAPEVGADDIPLVSYGNSEEANELFESRCKHFLKRDTEPDAEGFISDFDTFIKQFRRMNGPLQIDPDLEKDGLVIEPGIAEVKTSADNCGDDKGSKTHKIGYFAFYNKGLCDGPDSKPLPLVLGFHGGGDSCFFFATMAGWAKICHRHNFLLVTIENHLNSTATEMIELIEQLKKKYPIDSSRIYATGFSMGGCKTWDLIQEYPQVLAAAAPMDATFDVGCNVYGNKVEKGINTTVPVPVFYAGGEVTPLPELPFQEQKCLDRMAYTLLLNNAELAERYEEEVKLENKDTWENKIWGINGDETETSYDESRDATLTMQKFRSTDGRILSIFASISGQGHDCREHTCEHAWNFMSQFTRK
jgi:poly(3-hydroxybutyrate) depolymerase